MIQPVGEEKTLFFLVIVTCYNNMTKFRHSQIDEASHVKYSMFEKGFSVLNVFLFAPPVSPVQSHHNKFDWKPFHIPFEIQQEACLGRSVFMCFASSVT